MASLEVESDNAEEDTGLLSDIRKASGVLKRVWFLAVLAGMFHMFLMLEVHFYLPYLYTRVHCCGDGHDLDSRYDITTPSQVARVLREAKALGLEVEPRKLASGGSLIRACSVPHFPSGSELWSLSPSCANRAFVQDSAQGIMAFMKPVQKVVAILILPIGGTASDAIGRAPVLAVYISCLMLASMLSAMDCWAEAGLSDIPVYVAGMLFCATFQPKDSIISSGIADVMGKEEAGQSRAFASLTAMNTAMSLMSIIASYYFVRMHLMSYLVPWIGFALLAAAMIALLAAMPETLPASLRQPLSLKMVDPIKTQVQGLQIIARDPVLVQLSVTVFLYWAYLLGFFTTRTSYLILVGFSVEETMLPELVGVGFGIFFSAWMFTLLPRIGVLWSITFGHGLWAISMALYGPLTVVCGRYWTYLANVFQVAGVLVINASVAPLVSQRVDSSNQGKCQSAVMAMGSLGGVVSVPIYNHVLFNATWQGFGRALPAFVSMLLALSCFGLSFRIHALARTTPPASVMEPHPVTQVKDPIFGA